MSLNGAMRLVKIKRREHKGRHKNMQTDSETDKDRQWNAYHCAETVPGM